MTPQQAHEFWTALFVTLGVGALINALIYVGNQIGRRR